MMKLVIAPILILGVHGGNLVFTDGAGNRESISYDKVTGLDVPGYCKESTCSDHGKELAAMTNTLMEQSALNVAQAQVLAAQAGENTALRDLITALRTDLTALAKKHNDDIADSTSADAAFAKADATLAAAVETVTKMQGPKGDKGDTGAAGAPGAKGDPGTPGKDGKDGTGGLLQEYDITGQTCVSRTGVTGWKIVMGSNIDYFKPKPGFSFCDALKSNNGYLWAPSKLAEFVAPSPYSAHTGGSAALWPRQHTNGVDGRRYLPFWDINSGNVGVGTNGCCHYSKTDTADWGREYKMFAW